MFNFTPPTIPHNIFVIGAGGTGSRLIPLLSQFLRSVTRGRTATGWIEAPNIWLIDDDVVEAKNILRQNFIERDVGKHKAVVLAERYSHAYGVSVIPITQRVNYENKSSIDSTVKQTLAALGVPSNNHVVSNVYATSIVIMCVDSVEARRDILNQFIIRPGQNNGSHSRAFIIDAGNEDNFGQVSFFTPAILYEHEVYDKYPEKDKIPKLVPVSIDADYLPMDVNYYKNLVDTPAQGSCADLNQTLAINAIMATTIMGIVQNYYYRKTMTYNSVSISLDGGSFTTHNTFNNWKGRSVTTKDASTWSNGTMVATEKDGRKKALSFSGACNYTPVRDIAAQLRDKIYQEEQRALAEKRKAEDAERKRILKEKLAQQKLDEERAAAYQAKVLADKAKELEDIKAAGVIPSVPLPVPEAAPVVDAPALQSIGRQRRQVTLEVPESWNAVVEAAAAEPAPRRRTRAGRAAEAAGALETLAAMGEIVDPSGSLMNELLRDAVSLDPARIRDAEARILVEEAIQDEADREAEIRRAEAEILAMEEELDNGDFEEETDEDEGDNW